MKINPEGKCEEKYRRKCEETSPTSCCEGKLSAMWAGWFLVRFPRPILVDSLLHRLHLLSPDPAHKPVGAVENLERFRKEIAWLSINFIFSTSWVALYSVVCLCVCQGSSQPTKSPLFSCPGQLNRWPCHSLTQWLRHLLISDHNYYNYFNDYNDDNDYNDYND